MFSFLRLGTVSGTLLDRQSILVTPVKRMIGFMLLAALIGGSMSVMLPTSYRAMGLLVIWLTGAGALGCFLGLLFGIPRSKSPPAQGDASAHTGLPYSPNTNFEDISDWLTKIIVGATLVELHQFLRLLWRIAKQMDIFKDGSVAGASLVLGASITALVAGFIWMYLWTRSQLTLLLLDADREGSQIFNNVQQTPPPPSVAEDQEDSASEKDSTSDTSDAVSLHDNRRFNLTGKIAQLLRPTGQAPWAGRLHQLTSAQIYHDDFNKGQFGGSPIDNGHHRRLSAVWAQPSPGDKTLRVYLIVESLAPMQYPLQSAVTFYLHPTFPAPMVEEQPISSKAMTIIELTEAFTIGVECDGGYTRLELDLAQEPGFPPGFGGEVSGKS